ncbi:unnamed protein product [Ophioblennius macclurei]
MSAPSASLYRCCHRSVILSFVRRQWNSSCSTSPPPPSPSPPPPLYRRFLLYLAQRFHDVETLLYLNSKLSRDQLQKKNAYYGYTRKLYGKDIASAYFILSLKGGFRFVGQSEWYRADRRGRFNWDFLQNKDTHLEEVDMSHTVITYNGLENLKTQKFLRTLKLQGCPEVDDWFLAGLHVFQDSLEELDISHCPRITVGGLVALRNLKGLKHLNMSSLPKITNPGLVVILLEEMLPKCLITANGYNFSIMKMSEEEELEREKLIPRHR